ncbi:hypothetical protein ACFQVA_26745 [Actinomadura keratinilytica]
MTARAWRRSSGRRRSGTPDGRRPSSSPSARHPDPGGGQAYARRVNSTLTKARPDMFEKTTRRDFWKGGAAGHASVEIYFYTY